jgi:hypothetical protein
MFAYLALALMVLAIAFGALIGSRWAGERGWVYNKHNPRPPGAGGTLGIFEQIFQPGVEHVVEERSAEAQRADQDESGDKPVLE